MVTGRSTLRLSTNRRSHTRAAGTTAKAQECQCIEATVTGTHSHVRHSVHNSGSDMGEEKAMARAASESISSDRSEALTRKPGIAPARIGSNVLPMLNAMEQPSALQHA